jgi:hypothetical protein
LQTTNPGWSNIQVPSAYFFMPGTPNDVLYGTSPVAISIFTTLAQHNIFMLQSSQISLLQLPIIQYYIKSVSGAPNGTLLVNGFVDYL